MVLQNIISSDGSSCQHRIFPEMSSQNSYSDITTRVAITSYKIAKNVWFYVSRFKYANTIETLGTLARSGTPNLYNLKKQKMAIQKRFSAVVEAVDLAFIPISSLITTNSSSEQHLTIHQVAFRAYYEG